MFSQTTQQSVDAQTGQTINYSAERIIGNGSFGVVFQASVVETGETVAIKKVAWGTTCMQHIMQWCVLCSIVVWSHSLTRAFHITA
jgi:hypothetical protein